MMPSWTATQLAYRPVIAAVLLFAGAFSVSAGFAHGTAGMAPLDDAFATLQPFENAPFPYSGPDPETGQPFLNVTRNGRHGHMSARGGVYWQDTTYSDNRVLLGLPQGFDLARPAIIVVYFHGNDATLERDVVGRQEILRQLSNSGLNGALVAPQMAVNALDSSAGRFWTHGTFAQFLHEAAMHLGGLYADAAAARASFDRLPVVVVAYSGGYDPAAFALTVGGAGKRVIGVILLDAAYGQIDRFVDWVAHNRRHAFFFSASSKSSSAGNAAIEAGLSSRQIEFTRKLPRVLVPGRIDFISVPGAEHQDFATEAWVRRPVAWLLSRIPGFSRRVSNASQADVGSGRQP